MLYKVKTFFHNYVNTSWDSLAYIRSVILSKSDEPLVRKDQGLCTSSRAVVEVVYVYKNKYKYVPCGVTLLA